MGVNVEIYIKLHTPHFPNVSGLFAALKRCAYHPLTVKVMVMVSFAPGTV